MSNNLYDDQELMLVVNAGVSPNVRDDQEVVLVVTQRLVPATIRLDDDQELMLVVERRTNTSFTFMDPTGNPLANGTLELRLNVDASANGKQISAKRTVVAGLDITGSCNLNLWTNDVLLPAGTWYQGVAKTAQGQPVWKRQFTVATGGIITYQT